MPSMERTKQGWQYVIPGCERRTAPGTVFSLDAGGQLGLPGYEPPTDRERLQRLPRKNYPKIKQNRWCNI
jgi:hypothetical protein